VPLRNLILAFMSPARRAAAEADSRAWKATCPSCGTKTSIWDLGGLRYKAAGKPLRGLRCPSCGKFGMHQVARE
jgi:DNA-directed RNA polymerase subunit RPC12/RpoP